MIINNPNSIILITGLILSKNETIWLKLSGPVNKTKLLIRWNTKNVDNKTPVIATWIFLPNEENKNFMQF